MRVPLILMIREASLGKGDELSLRKVQPASSILRPPATDFSAVSNQPTPASLSSDSDSESDVYIGARRNALTKKQRRHQHQVANGLAPPSHAEVRFSTRRAAKITNYNEDEEDDDQDDLEMTPSYWAAEAEDDTPAIDIVLDHRVKANSDLEDPDITKHDFEYYVRLRFALQLCSY